MSTNKFATLLNLPVNPLRQTVMIAAQMADLTVQQSLVGCINNDKSNITGYRITVYPTGSLEFETQKYSNGMLNSLSIFTDPGTIKIGDWFVATLRYSNNTLTGNINNFENFDTSFSTNIDNTVISNNSSGWILGNRGFVPPFKGSSFFGSSLWKKTLWNYKPLISVPHIVDDSQWAQSSFGTNYWGGGTSNLLIPVPVEHSGDPFFGKIGYAIVWNKSITDIELIQSYVFLRATLAFRGIVLP